MGKRSKQRLIVIILFVFIVFGIYYFYKIFMQISDVGLKKEFLKTIEFKEIDQNIFVKTNIGGLTGDHYQISFSDQDQEVVDKNKDLILYELEVYYIKKGIDSLVIYIPPTSRKSFKQVVLGKVSVEIKGFKYSEINDYQRYGLSRISVYDKIK